MNDHFRPMLRRMLRNVPFSYRIGHIDIRVIEVLPPDERYRVFILDAEELEYKAEDYIADHMGFLVNIWKEKYR